MSRLTRGGTAVAVLLLLCGCTQSESSPEPSAPAVDLGFTQWLPDEGSSRALLRVINREPEPLTVTEVGIDWSGYGGEAVGEVGQKVVPAESELMLRFELPEPSCTDEGEPPRDPVVGRIRVGGRELAQPLTEPAQVYVHRLWRTQCDEQLLDSTVDVTFARGHEQVAGPGRDLVRAGLVLTRVSGTQPVRVTSAEGSVLYDLRVTGRSRLPAAAESARVGLDVLPGNRCDEHAIGQATAPYDFSVTLRIGSQRIRHPVQPPLAVQNAASAMLLRHCGDPR